jgi:uncharacterized protein YyaL (SSP411 family)
VLTKARPAAICALALVLALFARAAAAAPSIGDRREYLKLAADGIDQAKVVWWNPAANWYKESPHTPSDGPRDVATLWQVFPLFEAIDLVAIADPSRAHRAAVAAFARGAERYWHPGLKPIGGYWYLPFDRPNVNAFFDDNGWWGLAFFDAYAATHDRRFLRDAIRAFRFIQRAGWAAGAGGGIWWDTAHERKTSEPLAAQILLGAELYGVTHARVYLNEALKLLRWADRNSWNAARRLYQRNETDTTVMNYVEGMMIGAHATLCRVLHRRAYCRKAEQLAVASTRAFPLSYHWSPQTDAIYLRWTLTLWAVNRNIRWYRLADYWARRAMTEARDGRGLFSKRWDGDYASRDQIVTHGGTLMLLAAVAAAPAPKNR